MSMRKANIRKMWKALILLVLVTSVFHCVNLEEISETQPMIYDGKDAKEGQFPWMVALYFKNEYCCSGTLISDRLVLTAAHCIVINGIQQEIEDYHGRVGSVNRTASMRLEFEHVYIHPGYNFVEYDIAVLRTKEIVHFRKNISQVCIAKKKTDKRRYRLATAMGWGRSNSEPTFKDTLQYTLLYVVSNSFCTILQKTVTESTLCTASVHRGVCDGDSGGPLVVYKEPGRPYVVGVASYINRVLGCGRLSMYSRVSHSSGFILSTANDSKICIV